MRRRPRVKIIAGGGEPGVLGGVSMPCSHASQNGLWIYPVKGLGSLERLRRGWFGLRGAAEVVRGASGHQTWRMIQINTRKTTRS